MFTSVQDGLRAVVPFMTAAVSRARFTCIDPQLGSHRVRRDLAALSDHTLMDIGMSRTVSLHVSQPHRHLRAPH